MDFDHHDRKLQKSLDAHHTQMIDEIMREVERIYPDLSEKDREEFHRLLRSGAETGAL